MDVKKRTLMSVYTISIYAMGIFILLTLVLLVLGIYRDLLFPLIGFSQFFLGINCFIRALQNMEQGELKNKLNTVAYFILSILAIAVSLYLLIAI